MEERRQDGERLQTKDAAKHLDRYLLERAVQSNREQPQALHSAREENGSAEGAARETGEAMRQTETAAPERPSAAPLLPRESPNAFRDIRFRAPFSHRFLRILGYLFFAASHVYFIILLFREFNGAYIREEWVDVVFAVTDVMKSAAMPLLFLALLTTIISGSENIKRILIKYSICTVGVFLAYCFVFEHYLLGFGTHLLAFPRELVSDFLMDFILNSAPQFLHYNIFSDFALCAFFFFFVNYEPKIKNRAFRIFFRSLSVLPVLVVLFTLLEGTLRAELGLELPWPFFFLLPHRSLAMHSVFFFLSLYIKCRNRRLKKRRDSEYNDRYIGSNKDSLHFSLVCVAVLVAVSVLDYVGSFLPFLAEIGFGQSYSVIIVAPLLLLFSYTKPYKPTPFDLFLPAISFLTIGLLYVECFFTMLVTWFR